MAHVHSVSIANSKKYLHENDHFPAIKLHWYGISQPAMFDSRIHRMTGFLLQGQEARGTPQRLAVRGDQLDGPHLRRIRGWNCHGKMMKNLWRIIESHEKWNRSWLGLWWLWLHVIVPPWGIWWCHLWVDGITARMLNNCSVTQLGSCRGPVLEKSVGWTWKDQWR